MYGTVFFTLLCNVVEMLIVTQLVKESKAFRVPDFFYHIEKFPQLDLILSQLNLILTFLFHVFKNIYIPMHVFVLQALSSLKDVLIFLCTVHIQFAIQAPYILSSLM
jgi:hypothetical protein